MFNFVTLFKLEYNSLVKKDYQYLNLQVYINIHSIDWVTDSSRYNKVNMIESLLQVAS